MVSIGDRLRALYRGIRPMAKRIARDADVSHRTAEAWLAGRNVPSAEPLLRLMQSRPDLRDELKQDVARLGALKLARAQRERSHEQMGFAPPRGGSDQAVRRVRAAVAVSDDTGRDADHRALGGGRPDPRLPLAG